jgi:rhamnosyl/mannosyltransferase
MEVGHFKKYKVTRVPRVGKLMSTSLAPRLPFYLKKIIHAYDVLHVHFPDPMSALALYLQKTKVPLVVHWHSDIIKQKHLLRFYKPLQDWVLKKAARIIATSENYASNSEALRPYLKKVSVVPIGISTPGLVTGVAQHRDIKLEHPGKKIVFSLGRLVYYKGFEYLIKAATAIDENTIIIIGGEGPLKPSLQSLIKKNNLENKVFLAGKIPHGELKNYFKACDIFCLPAIEKSEAFGVVLLEAMCFGKPIVTSNIKESGICWVNRHNETGYNIQPKDALLLAETINGLLEDEDTYALFSKNAAARFATHFNRGKMVGSVIDIYKEIA